MKIVFTNIYNANWHPSFSGDNSSIVLLIAASGMAKQSDPCMAVFSAEIKQKVGVRIGVCCLYFLRCLLSFNWWFRFFSLLFNSSLDCIAPGCLQLTPGYPGKFFKSRVHADAIEAPRWAVSCDQLSVHDVLWNATFLHSMYMYQATQSTLVDKLKAYALGADVDSLSKTVD